MKKFFIRGKLKDTNEKERKVNYMSSKKIGLYMVLAGIVILALKLSFNTGIQIYPEYETDDGIVSEFQSFTLNYFYGANEIKAEDVIQDVHYTGFRIDLLSNIIGYIIIMFGAKRLKEVSKVFSLVSLTAMVGLALSVVIEILPFILNGYVLCYVVLLIGVEELVASIFLIYLIVYAISLVLNDIAYKSDKAYIGISYIGMSILMLAVAFIAWVNTVSSLLLGTYVLLLALVTGALIFNIYKVGDYIIGEKGLGEQYEIK